MQFEEQPMLALNKAIKYGTILLAILFIIPAMKYKKIYAKEKLGFLCPKKVFLKNVFRDYIYIQKRNIYIYIYIYIHPRGPIRNLLFWRGSEIYSRNREIQGLAVVS